MQTIAIYSRKSKFTGKGDSIENQIEMCKQYITQKMGKNVEFSIFEDEGFSGSTLERPQFKKLMKDIMGKKINALVCYRLDRISRNVADFSSTLTILQENNCAFISIKEEFDTTSPMGRAMIYIASVFAQLERETIAERVRDNMLELAKSGRWTGGKIPLGFISERIKYTDDMGLQREYSILKINKEEMDFVKFLYEKYLERGSLHKLEVYITENQLKSRNGIMFEKSSLKIILQNPIYVKSTKEIVDYLKNNSWIVYGEADNIHSLLTYNKTEQSIKNGKHAKILKSKDERFAAVSNIEGALEPELWLNVQNQFDINRDKFPRLGKTHNALLVGKLMCGECKKYMLIQHGRESKVTGEKAFYYTCSLKRKSHKKLCDNSNAIASYVDSLVIQSLKLLSKSKTDFVNQLKIISKNKIKSNQIFIEKHSLENSLLDKKKQIDTLVTTLSKCDGIEDIILDKIKSLKSDCSKIENTINDAENRTKKERLNSFNLNLIESMLNKCEMIDTFPRNEQKMIIDILIDCIYWYGTGNGKGKIVIKFIGTDDEDTNTVEISEEDLRQQMLQFGSHSMTCI
ncbi:MAG: recombinase family protein [Clostridium sp.]|uniref:recombinase family protein n=1 Tax=Clostridium sp. TaxID=1506 RepID=UPI003D6D6EB8